MDDAVALLNQVSDAYSKLRSLAIEATVISESGDEDDNHRNEQRVRFLYASPDRVRYEPLGKRGVLRVCDGTQIHTLFRHSGPMGAPHYNRAPVNSQALPHSFRPGLPSGGNNDAFLFNRINEFVKDAEALPDENGYRVVSVTYEPGPISAISTSPVRFWIDPNSFLIMRTWAAMAHRPPTHDEMVWTMHTVVVRHIRVDEPVPDEAFTFTPSADAVEQPGGRGMIGGFGGGGFRRPAANGRREMERHSSNEWQGETLVETSRWRIGDATFTIERRMKFSEGNKSVEIVERATGAKGENEIRYGIELS